MDARQTSNTHVSDMVEACNTKRPCGPMVVPDYGSGPAFSKHLEVENILNSNFFLKFHLPINSLKFDGDI